MKKFLFPFLFSAALFSSACSLAAESGSWRYRMTVNVQTPEGIKSGSAVREVTVERRRAIDGSPAASKVMAKGEAVVIDMGEKGALYALLKSATTVDNAQYVPFFAFPMPGKRNGGGGSTPEGIRYYSALKNVSADLKLEDYPLFVRFKDPADPTSVELVYSSGMCETKVNKGRVSKPCVHTDRFEEIYGPGVKLQNIVITMTEDEVTRGIEKYIEWLSNPQEKLGLFKFDPNKPGPENYLTKNDFKK